MQEPRCQSESILSRGLKNAPTQKHSESESFLERFLLEKKISKIVDTLNCHNFVKRDHATIHSVSF